MKDELRELVRKTIEETINAMLDEEADQLVGAGPYERTDERAAYRAGHYERGSTTTSGRVTLKMPKLKGMRFATAAVIERCKRRGRLRRHGLKPQRQGFQGGRGVAVQAPWPANTRTSTSTAST